MWKGRTKVRSKQGAEPMAVKALNVVKEIVEIGTATCRQTARTSSPGRG
jgi:hypothetical protein